MAATPNQNNSSHQAPELGEDLFFDPILFQTEDSDHALFFQKKGTSLLKQGKGEGVKYFDLALNAQPNNPHLYYEQGNALIQFGLDNHTKKHLTAAVKKFRQSISIDSENFDSWKAWGYALYILGKKFNTYHYIIEAKEKYEKALCFAENCQKEVLAECYWEYASVWLEVANRSEEVSDLNLAIENMTKASEISDHMPGEFWQQFGNIHLRLGKQLNDSRFHIKAVNCHKNAISISISSYSAWLNLGITLFELYTLSHDEDHFSQANECFANSAQLQPNEYLIWEMWSALLLESGKSIKDKKRLFSCIEKCHRGYSCSQKQVKILILWAEALAVAGAYSERIELLHEAHNKAQEAINTFGKGIETAYAEGQVLFCFGQFYADVDYYYQAIEKFQEGASIDRSQDKLWYALAESFSCAFAIDGDEETIRRATRFYSRAIHLAPCSTYYFSFAKALYQLAEYCQDIKSLEYAISHYEQAFALQKNAVYIHPDWLCHFALALDLYGDLTEEDKHYVKAIEILSRVLMLDPDMEKIHFYLGRTYTHLAELTDEAEVYSRANCHFKIAHKQNDEDDKVLLEWGLSLINFAESTYNDVERDQLFREAEYKLISAAKLGCVNAFYNLGCLYALMQQNDRALTFLEKARSHNALPLVDEILQDAWLERIRECDSFRDFVSQVEQESRITEDS
ncbi:MAG: hypothetical protein S4CHLAM102_00460 [Chlamydiia bacterium]|nr:hypothetical protein [Chlamydiia bacterium]